MKNKVDFLPEDYLEKKAQRRTNIVCLFLFLIVVVGVGAGFIYTEREQSNLKQKVTDVNTKMVQANESLKQLENLENKKKEMLEKAAISAMLMEPVPRSLLLATTTNALPARVSLLNYKLISKEVVKKTETDRRSRNKRGSRRISQDSKEQKKTYVLPKMETTLEFTGIAPTDIEVAQLIKNLNESPLFLEVNLQLSEEHEFADESMRRFKIQALTDPDFRATNKDVELSRQQHIRGM